MISCSNCGSLNPPGLAGCQRCGAPVSASNSGGASQWMGASEQPELPAWLQTLRAGEQAIPEQLQGSPEPSTMPVEPSRFSASNLIDENTLPSWMRTENIERGKSSTSTPGTPDTSAIPPAPQSVQEEGLPSWMRSENMTRGYTQDHPAVRPASAPAPDTDGGFFASPGLAASSFVDQQSLPAWMQEQQTQDGGSHYAGQRNIEASSLVQQEALPDWMKAAKAVEPLSPFPPSQPYAQSDSSPMPQGLTGHDLLDEQSLPSWMTASSQNNPTIPPPASMGQAGMSASSLLDPTALPAWLRESGQPGQQSGGVQPAAHPPQQHSQPQQQPNVNNNLVAASLIDMNSLPQWLRPEGGNQPQQAQQAQQGIPSQDMREPLRQSSPGMPPRVDSVRVPGRPRAEIVPQEESEAAANAFTSMLGVASVSPYLPYQQQNTGYGASPQQLAGTGMPPGFAPPDQQYGTNMNPGNIQGNWPAASQNEPQPIQLQQSASAGMQYSQYAQNGQNGQASQPVNEQSGQQPKTRKRGIVEALRDFFFRG